MTEWKMRTRKMTEKSKPENDRMENAHPGYSRKITTGK